MTNNTLADNLLRLQSATEDIADAITEKGGTASYSDGLEAMGDKIRAIPNPQPVLTTKTIIQNGTYIAEDDSADGYSEVTVAVPETYALLFVTTETGVTITVSKGQTTLPTQTCVSGEELVFNIPESGTWTVDGSNNQSDTITISSKGAYYVEITVPHIYGVVWDKSSSTTLTRTDDAASFSNPNPYYSGMSGTPSSPFDNLMPWSGMIQETIDGNVLVKVPKFWYKITTDLTSLKIQISDIPQTGFFVSPAHQDKGDGAGERDYVYIGRYKCSGASTDTYKSQTGKSPKNYITRATARTSIHDLGSNYWQQDFAMFWTIRLLYIVEFADWNSQGVIGYGCGNNSSVVNTGATDSMPYHTGTMASSRTTYKNGTQYRWIEGLWDNIYEWVDGIRFGGSNKVNIYCIKNPANFNDTENGTKIGVRDTNTSNACIKDFTIPSNTGLEWALYPCTDQTVSNSSYDTYIADGCYYNSSAVALYVGSYYNRINYLMQCYGMFFLGGNAGTSDSAIYIGTRLMYLPPSSNS